MEWFFAKSETEKQDLKHKHFPDTIIQYTQQWSFHFTFGHIEEIYVKELPQTTKQDCSHSDKYFVAGMFGGWWCPDCDRNVDRDS